MGDESTTAGLLSSTVGTFLRLQREAKGPKPTACGTPLRGSQAGGCTRGTAFEIARIPPSNLPDDATLIAFRIGDAMHALLQEAMHAMWPDFESEVKVDCRPLGFDLSGHADGVWMLGDDKVVDEYKTQSSFAFGLAKKSNAPKIKHVQQAAMYALGLGADQIRLVYLAKEGSYRDGAKPGQLLVWRWRMDGPAVEQDEHGNDLLDDKGNPSVLFDGQTIEQIGIAELWRLQAVWDEVKEGVVPARDVPGFGLVDVPPPYITEKASKGQPWNCRYCWHRDLCAVHPTEAMPVDLASGTVRANWKPPVDEVEEAGVTL